MKLPIRRNKAGYDLLPQPDQSEGVSKGEQCMGRIFLMLVLGFLLVGRVSEGKQTIDDLKRDLSERQVAGDRKGEGITLNDLGLVYRDLGQHTRAIEYFEQALAIHREVGNRTGEGVALDRLSWAYYLISQYARAIEYSKQALAIHREVGDRTGEGVTLNNLGWVYRRLDQYARAIEYFEQALAIHHEVENRTGEYETFNGLGLVYRDLGQYVKAIKFLDQALAINRGRGVRVSEGHILNNLGLAYIGLGQNAKAIEYFEQALAIYREVENRRGEGIALNNLGSAYRHLGQYDRAIESLEQALTIHREVGHRGLEGLTFKNLGLVYYDLSQYSRAIAYFEQALVVHREVGSRAGEGITLNGLMLAWQARSQPRLAIFYGKQAVNVLQDIRTHIQPLEQELRRSFLTTKEDVYRRLADVLIDEGRLPEAQQVLELLKEQEYFDFIRRDATTADTLQGRATLTPHEAAWMKRYRLIADRVSAISVERSNLLVKSSRTEAEEARLTQVEADLTVAGHAFQQFLDDLAVGFSSPQQAQEKLFHLREAQGLMTDLRDLGPGTVILYTLVSHQQYRVMLITPDVSIARSYPISARELSRKVFEFRSRLQTAPDRASSPAPRPLAQELYEILVAPVAHDLDQLQARTLMWSLDGVLRYLPLAALHDGEQYLLERYRLAVFTPASKARLKDTPRLHWKGLGLGVSKAHKGFAALPAVVNELQEIIREEGRRDPDGVLPGAIQLDEAFTAQTMLEALRKRYPVVHIASHFQFRPGNETTSFLLLGDGSHLPLSQLKAMPNIFDGVDLVTLSACNTAIGGPGADGSEVEAFGVLAQRQGAKAVVATLWAVADVSTQALMQTFYRLRETEPGLPKVEALRQAQLSLLHSQSPTTAGIRTEWHSRPSPYAHPYYWAPFLLIGNWK